MEMEPQWSTVTSEDYSTLSGRMERDAIHVCDSKVPFIVPCFYCPQEERKIRLNMNQFRKIENQAEEVLTWSDRIHCDFESFEEKEREQIGSYETDQDRNGCDGNRDEKATFSEGFLTRVIILLS